MMERKRTEPVILVNKSHVTLMTMGHEEEALAYACGVCGVIQPSREYAETHCSPKVCEMCGKEYDRKWAYTVCESCLTKQQIERFRAVVEKAKKQFDYEEGVVFVTDSAGDAYGGDEGFHHDIDAAFESIVDTAVGYGEPLPKMLYAWGTTSFGLSLNAADILEHALEEHHEDADVSDEAGRELQEFLDGWCAKQDVLTYEPDYSILFVSFNSDIQKLVEESQKEVEKGG